MGTARIVGFIWILAVFTLAGVTAAAAGSSPSRSTRDIPLVENFQLERYLGTWYEIVRLPHGFEKNLEQVTATYSLKNDGKIRVLNRGFHTRKGKWSEAEGRAWMPDVGEPARLKVSFFLFFAADYRVIALDETGYSWAMVTSGSRKYLWILSRSPRMEEALLSDLIRQAEGWGFPVEQLIRVPQTGTEKDTS